MPSRNVLIAFGLALILGVALGGSVVDWSWKWAYEQAANQQTSQHGADKKQPSSVWHWATHDAVAVYTLLLCVVTGVLAYVTYGLYRATVRLAADGKAASDAALKATVDAANLARAEFITSHRPRMRVREFRYVSAVGGDAIRWTLSNVGGSKAIIRGVLARTTFAVADDDLLAPDYSRCVEITTMTDFDPGNLDEQVTLRLAPNFSHDSARWFYVFGYVAYADELGNGFLTAFIRKYDWPRGRFVAVNDPDYEHED